MGETNNFSLVFDESDYIEVHNLTKEFQNGNKECGELLLDKFNIFLEAYPELIVKGIFHESSSSIREFIKLYIPTKEDRCCINKYTLMKSKTDAYIAIKTKNILNNTICRIKGLFSKMEREDVIQVTKLAFLDMCNKYKSEAPTFHNYIKMNYHFYIFRHLEPYNRDTMLRLSSFVSIDDIFDSYTINHSKIKFTKIEENIINKIELDLLLKANGLQTNNEEEYSTYEDNFLDFNWVSGDTCSNVFKCLTDMERLILILWYIKNYTDTKIGNELGYARGNINIRRNKAKNKLLESCIKHRKIIVNEKGDFDE